MSIKTCQNGLATSSNNISKLSQSDNLNRSQMTLPLWLLKAGVTAAVGSIFLNYKYLITLIIVYAIFCALNSDLGLRCLATVPRDFTGLCLLIRIQLCLRKAFRLNRPIHELFLSVVEKFPDKPCVVEVESGRSLNFREFNEHANKYANYFRKQNYKKDDVVAVFLENGIEFFASWFGVSKLGVISAWINSNLKKKTLAHSLKISRCKAVVTSQALLPRLIEALEFMDENILVYLVDGSSSSNGKYELLLDDLNDASEPPRVEELNFQSILCYIYTSGTTGNPKAAIINHYRYYYIGTVVEYAFGVKENDRIYITLPMYHSSGGILGIGQVLARGTTAVIRKKFSASNFWQDCVRYDCTVSQYIGEICRYLLAQKPSEEENRHKVKIMYGNGMRPEIWGEFVRRFQIGRIGELYGSTEGNSNISNLDNHQGSCGFMPIYPFLHRLGIYPIRLIKVDEQTGEVIRDPVTGLCVSCQPGEVGEMIGTIRSNDPMLRFEGYVNKADTQKKIITDVFKKGDCAFSSGDLLYWDEYGYLYFKDRQGDTFRWKGENCATTEVEAVVQPIMDILDATVYGVVVPNCEGRAGMISVALADDTDVCDILADVAKRLNDNLAAYAIPVFLRVCKEVDKTGTFKLKKNDLQKEGYDLEKCGDDPIYLWDATKKSYQKLNFKLYGDIQTGVFTRF